MKVIAAIQADFESTPIGTRSRIADELGGVPILRRTVERVRRAKNIAAVYVLCPGSQHSRCATILEGTGAMIRPHNAGPAPYASLVQTARKWSLDGWRGGIGGTTVFDEYADLRLIDGMLKTIQADAILSVPPAAVVFDPDLADRMIEHREKLEDDSRLTFAQAPPGLAGLILDATLIREISARNIPIGWLFSYQPDGPRKDLIFQPCCYETPAQLRFATGRTIADTDRATQRLADLLRAHPDPDSLTVGQWLIERNADFIETMPREIEIELTTDDPYPNSLLHPRGDSVPHRGPIDLVVVERIADELRRYDDSLVVLGGFGDPLRHPQFREVLEILRPAVRTPSPLWGEGQGEGQGIGISETDHRLSRFRDGVYGLCLRTVGVDLDDATIEAIVAHGVDVLNVVLDAWSPDLYRRLHAPTDPPSSFPQRAAGFCPRGASESHLEKPLSPCGGEGRVRGTPNAVLENVLSRIECLSKAREQRASARPIVLPEMTKARENVHELDAFYDGWLRRLGAVSLTGYSHYARQCEDRSIIKMAPATRTPCRRIRSRCLALADGRVTICDQDFQGLHTVGNLREQSLSEIWQSAEFNRIRAAHQSARFDPTPLCAACAEWHRP